MKRLEPMLTEFDGNPPALPLTIGQVEESLGFALPNDYVTFLQAMNGGDGGGEIFSFDMRSDTRPVVMVPRIGMELDTILPVSQDFGMFLAAAGES